MIEYSYFQKTILLASLYLFKFIVEVRVFYFSTKTYRRRKLRLLQKAIFHSLHQSAIHSQKLLSFFNHFNLGRKARFPDKQTSEKVKNSFTAEWALN